MNGLMLIGLACILSGCSQPIPEEPKNGQPLDRISDRVSKFCDYGRAVYTYDGYKAGGIYVIPNADECQQPKEPSK